MIGVVEALSGTVPLHGSVLGVGSGCWLSVEVAPMDNGASVGGGVPTSNMPPGAAVVATVPATDTAAPSGAVEITVARNPVVWTELSEVNTIVSDGPLDVTADAPLPDIAASTAELVESPSYSRKMS